MRAAPNLSDGSNRRRRRRSTSSATKKEGLFAYSLLEETRGFEIGSSASLTSSEDDGGSGDSKGSKRPLHGANPNKNRDGAPVNVVALDVKYIKVETNTFVVVTDDVDVGAAGDVAALVVVGVGTGVCGGRRGDRDDRDDGAVVAVGHSAGGGVIVVISSEIRKSFLYLMLSTLHRDRQRNYQQERTFLKLFHLESA